MMEISTLFQHTQLKQVVQQMQTGLADAQRQLSSGKKTTTYGGLGQSAGLSLSLRDNLESRNGYQDSIKSAENRISAMQIAVSRMATLANDLKSDSWNATSQNAANRLLMTDRAGVALDEVVSLLNTNIEDRHLFAGTRTTSAPVIPADLIKKGDGILGGLDRLTADRATADDVAGTGRLDIPRPTDTTVSVIQRNATFGFSINGYRSDLPATVTQASTVFPDNSLTINFTSQPGNGRQFVLRLGMPDGTETNITLTSRTSLDADQPDTFLVGATVAETARNFQDLLQRTVQRPAGVELKAASAIAAADDLFDTTPPRRVGYTDGVPVLMQDDPANPTLVSWYKGDTGVPKSLGKPSLDTTGTALVPAPTTTSIAMYKVTDRDAANAQSFAVRFDSVHNAHDINANIDVSAATDGTSLAVALQTALRMADSGGPPPITQVPDITVTYAGGTLNITDARGRAISQPSLTPASAAREAAVSGLSSITAGTVTSFSADFGGGIQLSGSLGGTLPPVPATGAGLAAAVQAALRAADGGNTDFTVTFDNSRQTLIIRDDLGRSPSTGPTPMVGGAIVGNPPVRSDALPATTLVVNALTDVAAATVQNFALTLKGSDPSHDVTVNGAVTATDGATLAAAIQSALQAADGGNTDITASYANPPGRLTITDARGRTPVAQPALLTGGGVAVGAPGPDTPASEGLPAFPASFVSVGALDDANAAKVRTMSISMSSIDPRLDLTVTDLDVSGATDGASLARIVQTALRSADKGDHDIVVDYSAVSGTLRVSDGKGRALQGFSLRGAEPLIQETAITKIDDNLILAYGRRADTASLRNMAKNAAILASQPPEAQRQPFYEKLAQRVGDQLATANRDLNFVTTEFGVRQQTLTEVKTEHQSVNLLSQKLLDDVENVDQYEAATRAMQFEKQLEMSYQITSRLQHLSLVDYL